MPDYCPECGSDQLSTLDYIIRNPDPVSGQTRFTSTFAVTRCEGCNWFSLNARSRTLLDFIR